MSEVNSILSDIRNPDPTVRERAVDRLEAGDTPEAFDLIINLVRTDPSVDVRASAACKLAEFGERAIPHLIGAVDKDPSELVRAEALLSLSNFRAEPIFESLLEEVRRSKRSRRPRQEVAKQLRYYDDERAVDALGVLLTDEDVFVRDHAADSLFQLNRASARPIWERALKDPSDDVRELARMALQDLQRG